MRTIGVIGASGQVGVELCIFLRIFPEIRVIAICRSQLTSSFLRRGGVECRIGDLASLDLARRLLAGCDLVFDLSLLKGLVFEVRAAADPTVKKALFGSIGESMSCLEGH